MLRPFPAYFNGFDEFTSEAVHIIYNSPQMINQTALQSGKLIRQPVVFAYLHPRGGTAPSTCQLSLPSCPLASGCSLLDLQINYLR